MKALIVMLAVSGAITAQTPVSGNFPRDLYGPVDTRDMRTVCNGPCIWGNADSAVLPIPFHPPAGYRVRILALKGDLVAWIKSLPGAPPTPLESGAGVLMGFETTSMGGTRECDYCASGCLLYIQDAVMEKQPKTRLAFDKQVNVLLDSDNVLNLKIASWLNTTGKPIHLEATYDTIEFAFEPIPAGDPLSTARQAGARAPGRCGNCSQALQLKGESDADTAPPKNN